VLADVGELGAVGAQGPDHVALAGVIPVRVERNDSIDRRPFRREDRRDAGDQERGAARQSQKVQLPVPHERQRVTSGRPRRHPPHPDVQRVAGAPVEQEDLEVAARDHVIVRLRDVGVGDQGLGRRPRGEHIHAPPQWRADAVGERFRAATGERGQTHREDP
jgi:hypothetical protein